jgi:hypothetical protein
MVNQKTINIIGFFTALIVLFLFISKVNFKYVRGKEAFIFWGVVTFYFLFVWQYRSKIGRLIVIAAIIIIELFKLIIKLLKRFYNQI